MVRRCGGPRERDRDAASGTVGAAPGPLERRRGWSCRPKGDARRHRGGEAGSRSAGEGDRWREGRDRSAGTSGTTLAVRRGGSECHARIRAQRERLRLTDHGWTHTPVRVAVVPSALAFVHSWSDDMILEFLPADRTGVATSLPRVLRSGVSGVRAYAVTGTADGFAVLSAEEVDESAPRGPRASAVPQRAVDCGRRTSTPRGTAVRTAPPWRLASARRRHSTCDGGRRALKGAVRLWRWSRISGQPH